MTNNNVTPIEAKQPAQLAKFTISATLDGFPIVIEGEGRAGDLRVIVDRLKAIGAEPPQATAAQPTNSGRQTAEIPRCKIHNSPMKEGRRGFFCPKKDGTGAYCRETA